MKVSIVTVCYNSAATIAEAMHSVLDQTWPDIEYWVIDGGSSDGTQEIIRSFEEPFGGRLHWISEPDKGIYDAMNKGIRLSTGDVVGILNSDDLMTSPDVISRMVEAFADDVDAVYGDVKYVQHEQPERCVRFYSSRWFRPSLLSYGFMPHHASFYARRGFFDEYGYYDPTYRISGDFELIARFIGVYGIRTRYLHQTFVTMRIGGVSTRGWSSIKIGTEEDLRALHDLHIPTNVLKVWIGKYLIKTLSMLLVRK